MLIDVAVGCKLESPCVILDRLRIPAELHPRQSAASEDIGLFFSPLAQVLVERPLVLIVARQR